MKKKINIKFIIHVKKKLILLIILLLIIIIYIIEKYLITT